MSPAQICGDRGAAELGIRDDNICGRQSQIKIEACETVKCDAAIAPRSVIGRQEAYGRNVGRQVERVDSERALQRLPSVGGECQHAFRGIAVKFGIHAREADGSADYICPRLDCKTAKSATGQRLLSGPSQRIAQRCRIRSERAFNFQGRALD